MTLFCTLLHTFAHFCGYLSSGRLRITTFIKNYTRGTRLPERFRAANPSHGGIASGKVDKSGDSGDSARIPSSDTGMTGIGPPPPQSASSVYMSHFALVLSNLYPLSVLRVCSSRRRTSEERRQPWAELSAEEAYPGCREVSEPRGVSPVRHR